MKTFILNVKTYKQRKAHMLNQLVNNECLNDYIFIHDGDIVDITPSIQQEYFGGDLNVIGPHLSCAYKHLLAYQHMLEHNIELALVLEDDIYLRKNFCKKLSRIVTEINNRSLSNFIISLEDSILEYVKGSELKKNTFLYKKERGRTAGAYLIDKAGAHSLIQEVMANKCNIAFDWFHNHCVDKKLIDIYWAHPVLAIQGSLNGKFPSTIDNKKTGFIRVLTFNCTRLYKKLLYRLR